MRAIIATWPFSLPGVRLASTSATAVDAVTSGLAVVERDGGTASVGYGGMPNADGKLQLDAAIMTSGGAMGSVAALEGYRSAIGVARMVMEKSEHAMLVGEGAGRFARENGMEAVGNEELLTDDARERYERVVRGEGHGDTCGMIAMDDDGLVAGCATSGMAWKYPGRVGDSPIVGCGLYADACGAAVCSGDGDVVMGFCAAFLVVERMRMGEGVGEACEYVVGRVVGRGGGCRIAVCGMDGEGNVGFACSHEGFEVVIWRGGEVERKEVKSAGGGEWG